MSLPAAAPFHDFAFGVGFLHLFLGFALCPLALPLAICRSRPLRHLPRLLFPPLKAAIFPRWLPCGSSSGAVPTGLRRLRLDLVELFPIGVGVVLLDVPGFPLLASFH